MMNTIEKTSGSKKFLPFFRGHSRSKIVVPSTAQEFKEAVESLQNAGTVGFAVSLAPKMREQSQEILAVVFVTAERGYIFLLDNPHAHNPLLFLLSCKTVSKVGWNLSAHRRLLAKKFGVTPEGIVDIASHFKNRGGRHPVRLRVAVASTLGLDLIDEGSWNVKRPRQGGLGSEQQVLGLEGLVNYAFASLSVCLKIMEGREIV